MTTIYDVARAAGVSPKTVSRVMRLGRSVAVKVFRQQAELTGNEARQEREIQVLARLQHPNIVSVFDAGTQGALSFVVMQLIDGVTLATRITASALDLADVGRVGAAVAEALAYVHSAGMAVAELIADQIRDGVAKVEITGGRGQSSVRTLVGAEFRELGRRIRHSPQLRGHRG